MLRNAILFMIICLVACGSVKVKNELGIVSQVKTDEILWSSERRLSWGDFVDNPPKKRGLKVAETRCKITYFKSKLDTNLSRIKVKTFFLKNDSWTITDSEKVLEHEQVHFDIYEIYARQIRKEFSSLSNQGETDFEVYRKIFYKMLNLGEQRNKDYDREVYFNDMLQLEWQEKIAQELQKLKEYEYVPEEK